jgi:hypothetical protein
MDWIPVTFVIFKVLVFGTGMFFAVKWHYDQDKKSMSTRALLRTGGTIAVLFIVLLVGVLFLTFGLARTLGIDLNL